MYTDACEATHVRGEQSAEVLDLRMACLNERLGNARALSDVFASADGKVVENAVSAAAALPSLDRCADVAALRAVVKPPEDPATRKRVEDLRGELAQPMALRDSGQCARATAKADALIAEVRAVGYQPLLAETLFESAQLGTSGGDAETLQRFREARRGHRGHNDEVAAQASAHPVLRDQSPWAVRSPASGWGRARGRRAAGTRNSGRRDAGPGGRDAGGVGTRLRARPDAADHSIAITRRLLGPDDPLTINWEATRATGKRPPGVSTRLWRPTSGRAEHFERVLGPEHPRVALVWNNEGEVLNLLGRYGEAEVAYERAANSIVEPAWTPISWPGR